jgi:succinyl-CoA synthetase alpha subunit
MIVQFVPPLLTRKATEEALAAGVPYILVGAEKVPVHDALRMIAQAKAKNAILIGPGSVGMIVPEKKLKVGMVGGDTPTRAFTSGNIAILSKSGGMTSEIAIHLKQHGLGVSLACGLGGERVSGSDFADLLTLLEHDERTHASVIFGEIGGNAEEHVAAALKEGRITKPVVAFISGDFVAQLQIEAPFGHTGAILEKNKNDAAAKRALLKEAGVLVAERFDDIAVLLASTLK